MTATTPGIALSFDARVYRITPNMRLLAEIEDELGAIPLLAAKFSTGLWRVTDLVALIQIMLQSAGRHTDYYALGDAILADGVTPYIASIRKLLSIAANENTP